MINISRNVEFYEDYCEICDCIYCQYYIKNVKENYKEISKGLDEIGVDIAKPFELGLPHLEGNKLTYDFAQYIVFGNCDPKSLINKYGLTISYTDSHPGTGIEEDHFVIEISSFSFELKAEEVVLYKD